jgi:dephospho-CoA kinase
MKVIGLTGRIGSGKSTVSKYLEELGAVIIDADKVTHEVLSPKHEIGRNVIAEFGQRILNPNGKINRKKLGEIVFNNPEALERLTEIMHPPMYELVKKRIEEQRRQGIKVVILEVIALIEANWTTLTDEIWVTIASEETVIKRIKEQRGMTEEQILSRIRSQLPIEEWIKHADVVIDNNGDFNELKTKLDEQWARLIKE